MKYLALLLAAALLAGCSAQSPSRVSANHAECLVCKHENDLACVDIAVDASTPRTTYQGKNYCFCSEQCKKEFCAHPAKYASGR